MQLHRLGKSLFGKAALATAALSGLLFFAGAPGAQAADRDDGDGHRFTQTDRRFKGDHDRAYYNRQFDQPRFEYRERFERSDRFDRDRNTWHRDRDDHRRFDRDGDLYRD
jgi:hypothetical protein